jgi:hypothetical protein
VDYSDNLTHIGIVLVFLFVFGYMIYVDPGNLSPPSRIEVLTSRIGMVSAVLLVIGYMIYLFHLGLIIR